VPPASTFKTKKRLGTSVLCPARNSDCAKAGWNFVTRSTQHFKINQLGNELTEARNWYAPQVLHFRKVMSNFEWITLQTKPNSAADIFSETFTNAPHKRPVRLALINRPVTSLWHQEGRRVFWGAHIFWTMSNSFKLCPTHFSWRGEKIFLEGASPLLVTGLLINTKTTKGQSTLRSCQE